MTILHEHHSVFVFVPGQTQDNGPVCNVFGIDLLSRFRESASSACRPAQLLDFAKWFVGCLQSRGEVNGVTLEHFSRSLVPDLVKRKFPFVFLIWNLGFVGLDVEEASLSGAIKEPFVSDDRDSRSDTEEELHGFLENTIF